MAPATGSIETDALQPEPTELAHDEWEDEAWDEDIVFPPSDILSDEPPLETELHLRQLLLLFTCLEWLWRDRQDFYCAGNLSIYYSPKQRKSEKVRGPDFFVVLGTERKSRSSWVVWEEGGQYPNVIVEVLSRKTAKTDRGLKKQLYQDIFRTPEYFWFNPVNLEFKGFELLRGQYQELQPNEQAWLWSQQLELFLGIYDRTLRFFTPEGALVPTPAEAALMAEQHAEAAQQHAESAQQQAETAQQQTQELSALLKRYQEQFGDLPEA
jgi:Uma2 family endonuclease